MAPGALVEPTESRNARLHSGRAAHRRNSDSPKPSPLRSDAIDFNDVVNPKRICGNYGSWYVQQ